MTAPTGNYPAPGDDVERPDFDALLSTLAAWLNDRGQQLMAIDERAALHGTDAQRADVNIAFVLWQAASERRDELASVDWPDPKRSNAEVADLVYRTISDRTGTALAANLPEAVAIVDDIASRLTATLNRTESASAAWFEARSAIAADLDVAERLALTLGDQVRAAAGLRAELERLTSAGTARGSTAGTAPGTEGSAFADADMAALRSSVARLRADLESTDRERQRVLAECNEASGRLEALSALEADARSAVAACADRFTAPPRLAVPSVEALELPPADLADRPWPQARPLAEDFVDRVGRLERALGIVIERNRSMLRERDDLRGLVQAYRDKAAAAGAAERPEFDEAFRRAKALLWSAPCDLDKARSEVAAYQALVRSLSGPGASSGQPVVTEEIP
ncbi:MAG: hypothetical protein K1X38_09550 [Microthrixaceae bacterium]|nr:hypothetical protein [Microthrixaceae bacterium]